MTGLNHVEPGGDPATVSLSVSVTMTKVSVGPMDNNAYLLSWGPAAVLIDAAHSPETLLRVIDAGPVEAVITTHRHHDHWHALSAVVEHTGARLVAGHPDARAIAEGAGVPEPEGVWDGEGVSLGSERLEVIGLVGHTPGSIALAYTGGETAHLFTGDSLFPGGPGATRSPADFTRLMDDLESKIFARFPDDTVVHPGHGDDTTLGAERPNLAEWRARGW